MAQIHGRQCQRVLYLISWQEGKREDCAHLCTWFSHKGPRIKLPALATVKLNHAIQPSTGFVFWNVSLHPNHVMKICSTRVVFPIETYSGTSLSYLWPTFYSLPDAVQNAKQIFKAQSDVSQSVEHKHQSLHVFVCLCLQTAVRVRAHFLLILACQSHAFGLL